MPLSPAAGPPHTDLLDLLDTLLDTLLLCRNVLVNIRDCQDDASRGVTVRLSFNLEAQLHHSIERAENLLTAHAAHVYRTVGGMLPRPSAPHQTEQVAEVRAGEEV